MSCLYANRCLLKADGYGELAVEPGTRLIADNAIDSIWEFSLPASVTVVGSFIFSSDDNYTVYYEGTKEQWEQTDIGDNNALENVEVHYNSDSYYSGTCGANAWWSYRGRVLTISGTGAIADYASVEALPWHNIRNGVEKLVIEDGITAVGSYAFANMSSLREVTAAPSVKSIGSHAFWNCITLTEAPLSDNISEIGEYAFWNCISLTSVNIPEGITTLQYAVTGACAA